MEPFILLGKREVLKKYRGVWWKQTNHFEK
jgi:hypothetical protein